MDENEIKSLSQECGFLEGVITELTDKLNMIESLIALKEDESRLAKEKDDLRSEFETVKDKIKLVPVSYVSQAVKLITEK